MGRIGWLAAAVIVGLGGAQALDSGVHRAGPAAILLVAAFLLVPAGAAIASDRARVHAASILACLALLLSARWLAAAPLPALVVIALVAALSLLAARMYHVRTRRGRG